MNRSMYRFATAALHTDLRVSDAIAPQAGISRQDEYTHGTGKTISVRSFGSFGEDKSVVVSLSQE